MAYDIVLTWGPPATGTAATYQVTWTWGATSKTVVHPATDNQASFVTDTGVTLVHGNVIAASVAAADAIGQHSAGVSPTPNNVTVPTPPPPGPPTNVTLALTGTP